MIINKCQEKNMKQGKDTETAPFYSDQERIHNCDILVL